jgi:DNA/RNA endonuclease YhcR with UshA esterase domain
VTLADEAKPLTVAEAAKKVNEKVTVEFEVKSTGQSMNQKLVFLNSESNHRNDKNFTIVIDPKSLEKFAKAGVADPKAFYKGKTVRVTGTVSLYENKPQIKVDDPEQIKVVEKK